jgi:putative transposase
MMVLKAFRYRIYPNQAQQDALAIQFGYARFVYNWGLETRKAYYKEHGKGLYYHGAAIELAKLKQDPEHEWLREADSQALQQKLRDMERAYVNFFEGRAKYPKLKKKHDNQSIRYPNVSS